MKDTPRHVFLTPQLWVVCCEYFKLIEAKWRIYMSIIEPSLVQIMACRLFGAKPLSETMLPYCQLDPKEHISVKFYLKFKSFDLRKCTWKCHLWMAAILSWPQCVNLDMLGVDIITLVVLKYLFLYDQGSTLSFLAGCPKSHFLGWYRNFLVYFYLKLDNQVVNWTCRKDKLGWIWRADDP